MNKLIKNWSYLLLSDISQTIIGFFVFMILARKLNPEGYGTLNVLLALASLFSVFAINTSASQVITREVTLKPKTTSNILKIVFPIRILSLVFTIIGLIVYQIYIGETKYGLLFATALIVSATVFWDLAESIAFGHFVTKLTTIISISASLIWFLIVLILPSKNLSVNIVIWLYAGIFFIRGIVYIIVNSKKFIKGNNEHTDVNLNMILLMSMPFLWMRVVGTFGEQIPILLLKGYSGVNEVGYFAVGSRLVIPITMAISTALRAVFPFMTKLFQENKTQFNQKLVQAFSFVLIIGSSVAATLTITSVIWLPLFFGKAYQKSIEPFNYQAWFGVLLCFDLLLATVLSSTYRQKTLAIITTIDVFIVFPLLYFGSRYGAEGMAIGKLIGAFISIFYHVFVVSFVLKINLISKPFLLSVVYFLIFMITSIFVPSISIKLTILFLTVIIFIGIKSSPLRSILQLITINLNIKR